MKVVIIGQQDFGKSVLEKFLERGDEVAAVFCAPRPPASGGGGVWPPRRPPRRIADSNGLTEAA